MVPYSLEVPEFYFSSPQRNDIPEGSAQLLSLLPELFTWFIMSIGPIHITKCLKVKSSAEVQLASLHFHFPWKLGCHVSHHCLPSRYENHQKLCLTTVVCCLPAWHLCLFLSPFQNKSNIECQTHIPEFPSPGFLFLISWQFMDPIKDFVKLSKGRLNRLQVIPLYQKVAFSLISFRSSSHTAFYFPGGRGDY